MTEVVGADVAPPTSGNWHHNSTNWNATLSCAPQNSMATFYLSSSRCVESLEPICRSFRPVWAKLRPQTARRVLISPTERHRITPLCQSACKPRSQRYCYQSLPTMLCTLGCAHCATPHASRAVHASATKRCAPACAHCATPHASRAVNATATKRCAPCCARWVVPIVPHRKETAK